MIAGASLTGASTASLAAHQLVPYLGGKSRAATRLIARFPEHRCYAEVFAGGLSVLLRKPPSPVEVVNDFDSEMIHLYKMVKFRLGEFLEGVDRIPISRELFEDWLHQDPTYLNDVYRAVCKFYLIHQSFGASEVEGFGTRKTAPRRLPVPTFIEEFGQRICRVTFECLDAVHFIQRYDGPDTFFYVDPPYMGRDRYTQKFGGADRHEHLRDQLAACRGKWLLSHHDTPEIRALYQAFEIRRFPVPYSLAKGQKQVINELIISNYQPPKKRGVRK
jgi:DNA adenine methylase